MKKFITSCITILVLTGFSHAEPQTPMSAREIIDRMVEAYAACRTYSDEGEIATARIGTAPSAPRVESFQTAFVRPSSFRFGFWPSGRKKEGREYIFWKDGDVERLWWPPLDSETALETSLLRYAFPSQGASITIPNLLLPNLFRGTSILTSLEEPRLTKQEKVDGRKTFKIESKFQGLPLHVWIDVRDFLIIKIHRIARMEQFEFETVTKYKPRVNEDVSRDKLAYNPPPDSRAVQVLGPNSGPPSSAPISSTALRRSVIEEAPRLKNFGSSLKANSDQTERHVKRANADEDDVVRVETNLVVADVLVLDKQGKFIEGLSKKDFVVKEDDKPEEVGTFSLGDDAKAIRRSIVLIVDYSASQLPYVKTSMEAAKTLVDKLNPNDRMAIVTDDVELLVDFTSDKELLKAKLESLKTTALSGKLGRSKQYDALMSTLKELFNNEDLRPIIIFQTDGDQLEQLERLASVTRPNPYIVIKVIKTFTIEDLTTAAEKARVTVYSVIPGIRFFGFSEEEQLKRALKDWENRRESGAELRRLKNLPPPPDTTPSDTLLRNTAAVWTRRQLALFSIARFTGGWTDFLEQPEQADDVYTRILLDMNRRYIIGYYPTNRTRNGKRRKISIEVRGHPEYIVWGRKAYFAPEPE